MYFEELNKYIFMAQTEILKNDKICKLLYNTEKNYMSKEITESDKECILENNIYPFNFVPTETEKKCIINIVIDDIRSAPCKDGSKHSYIKIGNVNFIVLCHKDLWLTNNGLRPILILSELDKTFNKNYHKFESNQIGFNGLYHEGTHSIWNSSDWSGYIVTYSTFTM